MEPDEKYNGFEMEDFDDENKAKALINNLGLNGEEDYIEQNGNFFLVNDPPKDDNQDSKEYLVLTDQEADEYCEEYLDNNREMWVEAVKDDRTDESWEEWKKDVLINDGRGSIISGYDGNEDYETINGKEYCIYRTN